MDQIVLQGDSLLVLKDLPDNSIDSVVTDPPYGLKFMGKKWDYDVPSIDIWREVLRVLKPGGHLLSFGGTRTYHRMVVAIEDAGFEIRDHLQWIYGSGFPKSLNIGKAIDKAAGAEREKVPRIRLGDKASYSSEFSNGVTLNETSTNAGLTSGPAFTDSAKAWNGWGTALKPANEPIVLARKPLDGTVAQNIEKWGVGGLNIDGCRIEAVDQDALAKNWDREKLTDIRGGNYGNGKASGIANVHSAPQGRWPANVLFDEEAAAMLDEQSGVLKSGAFKQKGLSANTEQPGGWQTGNRNEKDFGPANSGGASRFFYVAKASKRERGEGNSHPTVKPIKLMEYLCKLVTPPGGVILDPFTGSGTTGVAAKRLGFGFIGIELSPEYVEIAEKRIKLSKEE